MGRSGQFLPDGPAVIRVDPAKGILDGTEGDDAQERLVDDGKPFCDFAWLDQLPAVRDTKGAP